MGKTVSEGEPLPVPQRSQAGPGGARAVAGSVPCPAGCPRRECLVRFRAARRGCSARHKELQRKTEAPQRGDVFPKYLSECIQHGCLLHVVWVLQLNKQFY